MKRSSSHWLAAMLLFFIIVNVHLQAQPAPDTTGAPAQEHPRFLQDLNLSDAQKAQIKQIRQSTPQGKERREAIMAVLTPEQKAQLRQELQQWKTQHPQPPIQ